MAEDTRGQMDISEQRETWDRFCSVSKVSIVFVIIILVLMAFFLT